MAHIWEWELKDKSIPYTLSWSILTTASGYNPSNKQCRLCLLEKWYILFQEEDATLNRRQEIFNSCRHKARLTLNPKAVKDDKTNFLFGTTHTVLVLSVKSEKERWLVTFCLWQNLDFLLIELP